MITLSYSIWLLFAKSRLGTATLLLLLRNITMKNHFSQYTPKVLELVAKEIGNFFTGTQIKNILTEKGVSPSDIQKYPDTKWKMINEALKSKQEIDDGGVATLIMEFLHPLNHDLNEERYKDLAKKVAKILTYDRIIVQDNGPRAGYYVLNQQELQEIYTPIRDEWEMENEYKYGDKIEFKNNKEKIEKLKNLHQAYIDTIQLFCEDIKNPTSELNDAYVFLHKKMSDIVDTLSLQYYKISIYRPFKEDLYSAEHEWNGDGSFDDEIRLNPKLSWDAIRPNLHKTHSQISEAQRLINEDENISSEEKYLEEINTYISEKRTSKTTPKFGDRKPAEQRMKIEISKIPDLNIKNVDDTIITKGKKKIALPKFSSTAWSKVHIKFIDDNNVYITADKKTATADYEGLGFRNDKNGKPNTAWKFLLELSKNNGETPTIKSPIPNAIKNQKRVLSDRLKTVFKNDTDPFDDFFQSKTYKIKIKLTPPTQEPKKDKYGIEDYLDETMTSQYETDE